MSLEQASFLAQIISAIAVFASLVFVGLQVNQATKAVRASSSQAHSAMYHAITTSLVDDGAFAMIWRKGLGDLNTLTDDEQVRFFAFCSASFRFFEASRLQWLRGQLDDEHWHTIEQHAVSLAAWPGIHDFWKIRCHWHCEAFRSWFESLPKGETRPLYFEKSHRKS